LRMRLNRKEPNSLAGRPLTAQRRLVMELLRETEGHTDAKELYRRASARDPSISPATVYRTLNLFKELGLVEERRLGKVRCYYELRQSPEHQHLVCQGCGKVIDFESPLVQQLVDTIRRGQGFEVTRVELYLEGYCAECDRTTGTE
jgi:Fe2+ or Zn2+ uptake regulation protein